MHLIPPLHQEGEKHKARIMQEHGGPFLLQ